MVGLVASLILLLDSDVDDVVDDVDDVVMLNAVNIGTLSNNDIDELVDGGDDVAFVTILNVTDDDVMLAVALSLPFAVRSLPCDMATLLPFRSLLLPLLLILVMPLSNVFKDGKLSNDNNVGNGDGNEVVVIVVRDVEARRLFLFDPVDIIGGLALGNAINDAARPTISSIMSQYAQCGV
jgi:hypothetical protein